MDRPLAIPALSLAACLAVLCFRPAPCPADVLRWIDDEGVVHFTDDPGSIPASRRGGAVTVIRQKAEPGGPSRAGEPPPAPPPVAPPSVVEEAPPEPPPFSSAPDEAAQLRAKIEAKETFMRQVDRKRSMTANPMRLPNVSPADLDLYNKYQAELPADRARLRELEGAGGEVR